MLPPTECDNARTFIISTPALALVATGVLLTPPDTVEALGVPSGLSSRSPYRSLRPVGQLLDTKSF